MEPSPISPAGKRPLTQAAHDFLRQAIAAVRVHPRPTGMPLRTVDATAGNGHDTLFLAQLLGATGEVAAFDIQQAALDSTAQRLREAGDEHSAPPPLQIPPDISAHTEASATATPAANPVAPVVALPKTTSSEAVPQHRQANKNAELSCAVAPATAPALARVRLIRASHADMLAHLPEHWRSTVAAITFNLGYLPGGDKAIVTLAESTLPAIEAALQLLAPGGLVSILCYRGHSEGAAETDALLNWLHERFPDADKSDSSPTAALRYRLITASPDAPSHAPLLLHIFHV